MKRTRRVISSLLTIVLLVTIFPIVATSPKIAQAKKVYKDSGEACASGNNIFFLAENDTQIQCYNAKTKKVKVILDSSVDGSFTRGFSNLSIKGKYIYFTWNKYPGSEGIELYVYRMNFKGTQRTKLACGTEPVIAGNRIIYTKYKRYYEPALEHYVTTSTKKTYSMSLNGKNKKKCSKITKKTIYISRYYGKRTTGNVNGYTYTLNKTATKITRKNVKTGKTTTVFSNKNGVLSFTVTGKYIYVQCNSGINTGKAAAYIVKTNGTNKAKVASWILAG